ncbi:hypothetical protein [Haloarcula sediminis]|uniref:hypothetical protein n=1 Tax=Haloarcula sediminis TaxID=3111777 RepID=UPI002D7853CB|nr:hypothetical protein [Haloarcula sp. CK38]
MADFFRVGLGLAIAAMGALAAVNHPLVDKFKRVQKAMGTKQSAADIEMSEESIMLGRAAGLLTILVGGGIALGVL